MTVTAIFSSYIRCNIAEAKLRWLIRIERLSETLKVIEQLLRALHDRVSIVSLDHPPFRSNSKTNDTWIRDDKLLF